MYVYVCVCMRHMHGIFVQVLALMCMLRSGEDMLCFSAPYLLETGSSSQANITTYFIKYYSFFYIVREEGMGREDGKEGGS